MDVKTLKFKTAKSFGNNGATSVTSILNSTLINVFGHFSHENLFTVYSFQAALSNYLQESKPRGFQICGDGRSTWNELIWSSVSAKAQKMAYFLAVNFYQFF